jgi:hypothetical protein
MRTATVLLAAGILAFATVPALAQDKKPTFDEKQFRQAAHLLQEDPLAEKATTYAKAIVIFTAETPKAVVVMGKGDTKWLGDHKKYSPLLMAAYMSGNARSQLDSGILRNDRYAGLLTLFKVYRMLREKDADFKIAEVEELLKLHGENKLMQHILELEKKDPTDVVPKP